MCRFCRFCRFHSELVVMSLPEQFAGVVRWTCGGELRLSLPIFFQCITSDLLPVAFMQLRPLVAVVTSNHFHHHFCLARMRHAYTPCTHSEAVYVHGCVAGHDAVLG